MSLRDKKDLSGVSIQDTFCRNMGIEEKHQEVFIFFRHLFINLSACFCCFFTVFLCLIYCHKASFKSEKRIKISLYY